MRTTGNMECPCNRDCKNRAPGCAKSCEDWKRYEQERNENYKLRAEKAQLRGLSAGQSKLYLKNITGHKKEGY